MFLPNLLQIKKAYRRNTSIIHVFRAVLVSIHCPEAIVTSNSKWFSLVYTKSVLKSAIKHASPYCKEEGRGNCVSSILSEEKKKEADDEL
jgi:hypothetical protein